MRLDSTTVAAMAALIAPLDSPEARQAYREGRFPRADKVIDLDRRYRWDLCYAAKAYRVVPEGTTDAHIETALRRIVPSLTEVQA